MAAALERALHAVKIPALGIWVQVPHYVAALPYPAASVALLDGLTEVTGSEVAAADLRASVGAHARARVPEEFGGLRQLRLGPRVLRDEVEQHDRPSAEHAREIDPRAAVVRIQVGERLRRKRLPERRRGRGARGFDDAPEFPPVRDVDGPRRHPAVRSGREPSKRALRVARLFAGGQDIV